MLLLGIPAMLLSFFLVSAKSFPSSDEEDILIRPQSLDPSGAPRNGVCITAYYDTETSCVCASLTAAGTSVSVEFVNNTTSETEEYVIPGSGSSIMPISGTAGNWSVTFTLESGDVYYGEFSLF